MRIAIIGRTEILYKTAEYLRGAGHTIACVLTAKEAQEYARTAEDFRRIADSWKVPFAEGPQIAAHVKFLQQVSAEIAVSMNYPGILPQSVIDLFPLGVLNAHGGDLPRYRGNACQAWAILNGEKRIGLCIHKMIGDELDSGDIISRDYLPLDHTSKVTQVWEWMAKRIPELALEAVNKLSAQPGYVLERQSREPGNALRCYPRRPEDGHIDWTKSAIDILRLINASNRPYAGAFCDFEGRKMTIWDAELVRDDEIFCAVPGQITKLAECYVEAACGTGKVRIKTAEIEGHVDNPRAWIRSLRERLT
jgi:UDP-4-amino-4-deoxy-L-arabinose formyltransferase/UDP-glucuronic acid dehydrogenase (UDP-4-keto-hexauronic acid decarboxylating)